LPGYLAHAVLAWMSIEFGGGNLHYMGEADVIDLKV
jgi:hypothetical protein